MARQAPRDAAAELLRELTSKLGDQLRGALLYGSVARGEYIEGVSNVNVLVLLEDISPALLQRVAPLARRWVDNGLAPLFLEREEWARAADVFAIELLDMADAHEVLHGVDPLAGLTASNEALRLQAERELRGKLVTLHNGMLHAAGSEEDVGSLLVMALPSFVTYLRAALRLAGQTVPGTCDRVIDAGAALIDFDPAGFNAALSARRGGGKWTVGIADPLVERYHAAAERTAAHVDRFGGRQA